MARFAISVWSFALWSHIAESHFLVLEKGDERKVDPTVLKEIDEYVSGRIATAVKTNAPGAHDLEVVGDMLVGQTDYQIFFSDIKGRHGLAIRDTLWPRVNGKPTVPYVNRISRQTYPDFLERFDAALKQWENHTCIKFRPRERTDKSYINIYQGEGCSSSLGRVSKNGRFGPQNLSLGSGCHELSTIMHELAHALGMLHEQMRADRDNYLQIMTENIMKDMLRNFDKAANTSFSDYGIPYDYTSIMHYDPIAFTTNGGVTMRTLDPQYQGLIGTSDVLSHRDKLLANTMYDCLEDWLTECGIKIDPCEGEGYIGADCKCVCPPGTKGYNCQIVVGTYYGHLQSDCNRIITTNGTTFSTPNHKKLLPDGKWCVFQIQAPSDHYISVIFSDFRLDQVKLSGPNHCELSYLVLMVENAPDIVVCGKDVSKGDKFNFTTNKLTMFLNHLKGIYARGFEATVYFYPKRPSDLKAFPCQPTSEKVGVTSGTQKRPEQVLPLRKNPPLRNTCTMMSNTQDNELTSKQATLHTTVKPVKNKIDSVSMPSANENNIPLHEIWMKLFFH